MNEDKAKMKLIEHFLLERIEITHSVHGVFARAIPHLSHPIVEERRNEKLSKLDRNTVSLTDMTELTEECLQALVRVNGSTEEECMIELERQLKQLKEKVH